MRILIYAHAFAPKIGGAETYVMLLADGLAARREVQQVTVATPTAADGFRDASLRFTVVRRPSLWRLWRLVSEADVVLLAGPCLIPLAISLIQLRPVAVEHHGYQAACPNGLLFREPHKSVCAGQFMLRRYDRCLRCVHATGKPSHAVAKVLVTFLRRWMCTKVGANIAVTRHVAQRIALPRCEVIYHGVPDLGEAHDGLRGDHPVFAYVGRLVSEKGVPLLLEAGRILKEEGLQFRLTIIGDGPERERLKTTVRNLGLFDETSFAGYLRNGAFRQAMRCVTALVMPSIWEETAGLAAIEHMMRGRLVIAADIGGLGEVVDGAGLNFRPGDARGLATSLRRVVEEPSLAGELGQRARYRAVHVFSFARMLDEHLTIFKRLAARGGQPTHPMTQSATFLTHR